MPGIFWFKVHRNQRNTQHSARRVHPFKRYSLPAPPDHQQVFLPDLPLTPDFHKELLRFELNRIQDIYVVFFCIFSLWYQSGFTNYFLWFAHNLVDVKYGSRRGSECKNFFAFNDPFGQFRHRRFVSTIKIGFISEYSATCHAGSTHLHMDILCNKLFQHLG